MRPDRRTVLKGSAMLAVAPVVGGMTERPSRLIVFDSLVPESVAFSSGKVGRRCDLVQAHATRWSAIREDRHGLKQVDGLTGWSDWIGLRGELESKGFRLEREERVAAPLSGKAHLFRWTMRRG